MTIVDPIANMISIINNGLKTKLVEVIVPHSLNKESFVRILKEEGYVEDFVSADERKGVKNIVITLKYTTFGISVIKTLVKISTPGRKIYSSISSLRSYGSGMGMYILSTSRGLVSERIARSLNVGGEVICKIF